MGGPVQREPMFRAQIHSFPACSYTYTYNVKFEIFIFKQ